MARKDGVMSLEYIFIIVISLITVFVLVGLITSWSFNAKTIMCKLSGSCGGQGRTDSQTIQLASCSQSDVIKYAKLCCQLVNENKIKQGEICYSLVSPSNCNPYNSADIVAALDPYCNATGTVTSVASNKYIISYDFPQKHLVIS